MTHGELFRSIMSYGDFNAVPAFHWGLWPETRERWIRKGLPADEASFLGGVPRWAKIEVYLELYPAFDEEVLEETTEYIIKRNVEGVVQKEWKGRSSIPSYLDHTLKCADQWPEFKKRLEPHPGRIPSDLDEQIARAEASGMPVAVTTTSLMGWIRNWMGVENMSYLMYDAPEVYADMVDTLADLACWGLDEVVPRMKRAPDVVVGWEDICFNTGPLVSPAVVEKHVVPGYRKIREKMDGFGIPYLALDCDGMIEDLLPLWLEAGVNLHYPLEIGSWNADPHGLRKKFGQELRMIGGFDKRVLERDREAIDAEIERRIPLLEEGGYIIMPDHHITPDTPMENYRYYLDRIRNLRFTSRP